MKLKPVSRGTDGALLGYAHWCQGCEEAHVFYTTGLSPGPKWSFDGNMELPSFTPSMRFFSPEVKEGNTVIHPAKTLCHYFLTKGVINYLPDSSDHALRGDHPLVDIPDDYAV